MKGRLQEQLQEYGNATARHGAAMRKALSVLVLLVFAAFGGSPAQAQDQPSLADVARKARKDKEGKKPSAKKVVTEDDMPSSSAGGSLAALGNPDALASVGGSADEPPEMKLVEAEARTLDMMDKPTMARHALEGNGADFPGRAAWEDKLFRAKQEYVAGLRAIVADVKVTLEKAKAMRGPDGKLQGGDPRVQQLVEHAQAVLAAGKRMDAAFEAVILECRELSKQAAH